MACKVAKAALEVLVDENLSENAEKMGQIVRFVLLYLIMCTLWQYGLWTFQMGGTKLEIFLPKNQHTQRKLLNFENWINGEVSKIGHHFRK